MTLLLHLLLLLDSIPRVTSVPVISIMKLKLRKREKRTKLENNVILILYSTINISAAYRLVRFCCHVVVVVAQVNR